MKRLTEFADKHDLEIVLAYYPPYHSNYNPIERCWGILENHWKGTLLKTLETILEWAKSMTWKGLEPVVEVLETIYKKGVRGGKKVFQSIADRITRHLLLPKYYVTIQPQKGVTRAGGVFFASYLKFSAYGAGRQVDTLMCLSLFRHQAKCMIRTKIRYDPLQGRPAVSTMNFRQVAKRAKSLPGNFKVLLISHYLSEGGMPAEFFYRS